MLLTDNRWISKREQIRILPRERNAHYSKVLSLVPYFSLPFARRVSSRASIFARARAWFPLFTITKKNKGMLVVDFKVTRKFKHQEKNEFFAKAIVELFNFVHNSDVSQENV